MDDLDTLDLDPEERVILGRLTPAQRANLVDLGREMAAALKSVTPTSEADTLPDELPLYDSPQGTLVLMKGKGPEA
jgi:hypothetical protein